MKITKEEKKIYKVFEIGIFLKGIHAIFEIVGGILVFLINGTYVLNTVLSLTQEELSEDPKDIFAHYLITLSNNFSISTQHFVALYLLSHGVIKLFLIIALLKKKLWAYPTSIVIFGLFIIYQISRYFYTHSIWLLLFTLFDIMIIWLTIHEYRYMKKYKLFKSLKSL